MFIYYQRNKEDRKTVKFLKDYKIKVVITSDYNKKQSKSFDLDMLDDEANQGKLKEIKKLINP